MSAVIAVPTLSTMGFVTDPVGKFDFLLSHFFLSDYNQTYLYKGFVTSLPRIIEKNGNNIQGVMADLKNSLNVYLGRYYDSTDVTITLTNDPADMSSSIGLNVNIGVISNGVKNEFIRLIQTANGKMMKITKLNNFTE